MRDLGSPKLLCRVSNTQADPVTYSIELRRFTIVVEWAVDECNGSRSRLRLVPSLDLGSHMLTIRQHHEFQSIDIGVVLIGLGGAAVDLAVSARSGYSRDELSFLVR